MKPILNSQFSILNSLIITLTFLIASSFAGPVSHFGMLKACKIGSKGQLCGENTGMSTAIFVKGPSLYWSAGVGTPFYNAETVDWFVDNMQIGVIRAAMAIRYYKENSEVVNGGYWDSPAAQKQLIKAVVNAAIVNDIYVIVDWHSHNAENETSQATEFFREMATEYKDVPNIIWEVYNEPVSASTSTINSYANTIINVIRNAGSNNLVIIGSPQWSQQPNGQASNWGSSDNAVSRNVGFVFHFYAGSHPQTGTIGSNANSAMNSGYAIFGSEWGSMNADGAGSVNTSATNTWTSWMDNNKVSNCAWSASALGETASMFSSGTTTANMATSRLSQHGQLFQTYMNSNKWIAQVPSSHPRGNDVSATVRDGESVSIAAAALGLTGSITGVNQPEYGNATFTDNSLTYTTSPSGSPDERVRFAYKITQNSITVQRRATITITNRRPILPKKNPISVSRRVPTVLGLSNTLSASDPSGSATAKLSFTAVSLSDPSMGTVAIIGSDDSLRFTPSASQQNVNGVGVELNYSVRNASGAISSQSITLILQNMAPLINTSVAYNCCLGEVPNTAPVGIGLSGFGARDPDGDALTFLHVYLDPQYPGRVEKVKADSFVYYPDNNKTGRVVLLAAVTDGSLTSPVGKSAIRLTGSGQAIGDLPVPNDIPGFVAIVPRISLGGFGMAALGSGRFAVNFAESGFAKLEIYSLSGKSVGTLLNGHQNAGSSEVSLSNFGLQKGVYILRLRQGSQVKTLRVVN